MDDEVVAGTPIIPGPRRPSFSSASTSGLRRRIVVNRPASAARPPGNQVPSSSEARRGHLLFGLPWAFYVFAVTTLALSIWASIHAHWLSTWPQPIPCVLIAKNLEVQEDLACPQNSEACWVITKTFSALGLEDAQIASKADRYSDTALANVVFDSLLIVNTTIATCWLDLQMPSVQAVFSSNMLSVVDPQFSAVEPSSSDHLAWVVICASAAIVFSFCASLSLVRHFGWQNV